MNDVGSSSASAPGSAGPAQVYSAPRADDRRVRLLVVDDHPVVRSGIVGMLSGEPDLQVVGQAADGAEAIALTRRLPEKNAALQSGVWAKSAEGAHEVRGKTLGIVGYGSIGTQLSVLAEALGMHVIFHDVAERLAIGNAARVRSLSQLLAASDIVSIHVDGRPSNKGFFGKDRIAEMKRGAILINLSRGSVV